MGTPQYVEFFSTTFPEDNELYALSDEQAAVLRNGTRMIKPDLDGLADMGRIPDGLLGWLDNQLGGAFGLPAPTPQPEETPEEREQRAKQIAVMAGIPLEPYPHLCLVGAQGDVLALLEQLRASGDDPDLRPSEVRRAERENRIIGVDVECNGDCVARAA